MKASSLTWLLLGAAVATAPAFANGPMAVAMPLAVNRPMAAAMPLMANGPMAAAIPVVATVAVTSDTPQPASGLPNIDSCLGRLDPELDIGYDRIAARCPELVKELDHGKWAPWLPRSWKDAGNDLSAGSLRELRDLVSREAGASVAGRSPDVSSLHALLSHVETQRTEGWWSRFKAWLRSVLEAREQTSDETWLTRMVAHVGVPQSWRQLIAAIALAAVVVLAAVIVVNELRATGLLPLARARRRTRGPSRPLTPEKAWSEIERAPLLDRPRLLLELIVRRLGELGSLPPAGALTVRELTRVARVPEPDDRKRLSELAIAAERVRYSARELEPAALEESIAHGRELLDRLETSTTG